MANRTLTSREKFIAIFLLVFTVIAFSFIEIIVKPVASDIAPL